MASWVLSAYTVAVWIPTLGRSRDSMYEYIGKILLMEREGSDGVKLQNTRIWAKYLSMYTIAGVLVWGIE